MTFLHVHSVDDGSDHDHDSHIMVWQVQDDPNPPEPTNTQQNFSKVEVESRSSRGSSSVDLGPAPGSGLVTTDASEASDTEKSIDRQLSLGMEMTESMTASSLMQFNKDVESMMENVAKEASEEPSEGSIGEPKEDFTQHIQ